jgi:alkanesulfonate monooxygenase SsuD/methylene tetrahydromethanopterin reductase-like flavin-dependent oxidoreductase (luciferase family)
MGFEIRFGSPKLPNHSPLIVAEQFGTLESLDPGRIDLGLGRASGSDQATSRAVRAGLDARDMSDLVEELMSHFASPTEGQKIVASPGAGLNVPIWLLGSSL